MQYTPSAKSGKQMGCVSDKKSKVADDQPIITMSMIKIKKITKTKIWKDMSRGFSKEKILLVSLVVYHRYLATAIVSSASAFPICL